MEAILYISTILITTIVVFILLFHLFMRLFSGKVPEKLGKNRYIKHYRTKLFNAILENRLHDIEAPELIIMQYLDQETDKTLQFIHFTHSITIANSILREGFKYEDSLHKTSEQVFSILELKFKLQMQKHYGSYLVIISIPRSLYLYIEHELIPDERSIPAESIISISINEEGFNYLLPNLFIRGYFDLKTLEVHSNTRYLENYNEKQYITMVNSKFQLLRNQGLL